MNISIEEALHAIEKTIDLAQKDKRPPVALAVVGPQGTLLAFAAMDKVPDRVVAIAQAKAYTAARMTASTEDYLNRIRDENLASEWFCDDKLTPLPGGIPIIKKNRCVGAVGISGRTLAEDVRLATAFAALF